MNNRVLKKRFLIGGLLTVSIALLLFYKSASNQRVAQELTPQEYAEVRDKYLLVLMSENPRVALDKLREETKWNDSVVRSCHALAHDLGHHAYEKYQDFGKAVQYKDELCNSGYLHGVIEAHFSKSADIFTTLQTVCSNYSTTTFVGWECYHGVGHGLMYYTSNNLPESIKLCGEYADISAAGWCRNGAYMENFNTDQKLHHSQFLRPDDPFYPCPEQEESHKNACYLYTPMYYLSLHKNDYSGALAWCKTAEQAHQNICANGVGNQAIKENINNPKMVEKICMAGDSDQLKPCISGLVGLYVNHFGSVQPAQELCKQLEESNQETCENVIKQKSILLN